MNPVKENPYLTQALLVVIGANNYSGMYMVQHLETLKHFKNLINICIFVLITHLYAFDFFTGYKKVTTNLKYVF